MSFCSYHSDSVLQGCKVHSIAFCMHASSMCLRPCSSSCFADVSFVQATSMTIPNIFWADDSTLQFSLLIVMHVTSSIHIDPDELSHDLGCKIFPILTNQNPKFCLHHVHTKISRQSLCPLFNLHLFHLKWHSFLDISLEGHASPVVTPLTPFKMLSN